MLRVTKNHFYVVPVLMRALDILEFLCERDSPIRMNEIATVTGVSQTTTYRILRTLVHRGYLAQDLEGRFSILRKPGVNSLIDRPIRVQSGQKERSRPTELSGEEVIEVLQSVLQNLRQENAGDLNQTTNSKQARYR